MFGRNFSTKQYVVAIFIVFALWSAIATAWYVCGVNNLCAIQAQAKEMTADPADTNGIPLADTQAPLIEGYDRSGAAGEIFIMLMIAFTLGALLGRILANSGRTETVSQMTLPIATEPAPRVGTPTHVSAFTKNIPRPPVITPTPPPKPEFRHAATAPAMRPPIVIAHKSPPTPVIHLGANTPKPAIGPALSTSTKNPERPKIKFNTSWSNPVRDPRKS
ncbi:hypothetical protein HY413_01075 [Candidatus Kaiserbacteria bacterium]|nr:hypothetical protein [Candidatus Kaiserbacteria bacterium]